MKNRIFFIALLAFYVLVACDKEDQDLSKPSSEILAPTNGAKFASGSIAQLSFQLNDNSELSQMRLDIHDVFDGHGHGKNNAALPWTLDTIINLTGKSQLVELNIPLPDNAASGPYHCIVQCIDKAGNEAEEREAEFEITSHLAPTIANFKIDAIEPANEFIVDFTALTTDTLFKTFTAELSDSLGLSKVKISILLSELGKNNDQAAIFYKEIDLSGETNYAFQTNISLVKALYTNNYNYDCLFLLGNTEGYFTQKKLRFTVKK